MTNAELIAKIKAEIERRKTPFVKDGQNRCYQAYLCALTDMEGFLSTLESEKPMNQEGLDQEIIKCWQEWISPSNEQSVEGVLPLSEFAFYARHFAQWGAEHLADVRKMIKPEKKEGRTDCSPQGEVPNDSLATQSYENIPKDLEEAAVQAHIRLEEGGELSFLKIFEAGASWQKEQMMEEAVEGEVRHCALVHYVKTNESQLSARLKQFQDGYKVRIIIVKEDHYRSEEG